MRVSVWSIVVSCILLASSSSVHGNKNQHHPPTPAPTTQHHKKQNGKHHPTPAPTTEHHGKQNGKHNGNNGNNGNNGGNNGNNGNNGGLHHAESELPVTHPNNPAPAPTAPAPTAPAPTPESILHEAESDLPITPHTQDEVADDGAGDQDTNPATSSDTDKEIEAEEPEEEAAPGEDGFKEELGEEMHELGDKLKYDIVEAEHEIMDYDFGNKTGYVDEFGNWVHGDEEIYPDATLSVLECEDQMDGAVQTYWDLVYSMVSIALLTILVPYLFSCFMDKHSFSVMRCIAGVYYFSGALNSLSGLLLTTALMPNCPVDCGEFFCSLPKYNPGPIYGVVVFFVGILWLLKGMMLQCRANKAEREYHYNMHLKNGGTMAAEREYSTSEQHEMHMESASRRALKPSTRPSKLGELI